MNKNALKNAANYKVRTATGKIPNNVGFPSGKISGGGFVRKLNPKEMAIQRELGAFVILNGKPFNGVL
jgi:hypothetical protein